MFEIWLGYDADELLATEATPAGALAALDRIADDTTRQLAANGEGADAFVLYLVVRDSAGDVAATFCALG